MAAPSSSPSPSHQAKPEPFEIRGRFNPAGQASMDFHLSTKQGRLRLEKDNLVVLKQLGDSGENIALDTDQKTFFRFSPRKAARLQSNSVASSRYKKAVSVSGVFMLSDFYRRFSTPCSRAEEMLGVHAECSHTGKEDGLQFWSHRKTNSSLTLRGFEKYSLTIHHEYDAGKGLIMSESFSDKRKLGSSLSVSSAEPISPSLFQVPAAYTEVFSEDELLSDSVKRIGWPEMIEGLSLREGELDVEDIPMPPQAAKWKVVSEKWRLPQKESVALVVQIRTTTPTTPQEFGDGPPEDAGWGFSNVKWDPQTEVGDRSYRPQGFGQSQNFMIFSQDGLLYRVTISPESQAEDKLLPLCLALAKKAREQK